MTLQTTAKMLLTCINTSQALFSRTFYIWFTLHVVHYFVDSVLCCCFSQTVLRIWDCLFYEGSKILFRVALTLIHHNQDLIQQSQSLPDVCQSFKQITHGPFVEECHTFMQVKTPTTLKNHHESFYGMKD